MANGRIRILVVAPLIKTLPELAGLPKEVMGFVNARSDGVTYEVVLLQGNDVDEACIERTVKENLFDIWWIASHGDKDGIAVVNGRLSLENLSPLVQTSRARLLVLHSCESIELANQLMQECNCDVIATITKLDDALAARTAGMFAVNLLRSGNPRTAYDRSRPGGNRNYVFISRNETSNMAQLDSNSGWGSTPTVQAAVPALESRLVAMIEKLQLDVTGVKNDLAKTNTQIAVMQRDVAQIEGLKDDIERLEKAVLLMQDRAQPPTSPQMWAILAVGFIIALLLIAVMLRLQTL